MPSCLQLLPEFNIVIDFPIKDDPALAISGTHRLMTTGGKIQNSQTAVAENYPAFHLRGLLPGLEAQPPGSVCSGEGNNFPMFHPQHQKALIIRPPMAHPRQGRSKGRCVDSMRSAPNSCDAAHVRVVKEIIPGKIASLRRSCSLSSHQFCLKRPVFQPAPFFPGGCRLAIRFS